MPTKPKATKNLNELNSADILNVTRSEIVTPCVGVWIEI